MLRFDLICWFASLSQLFLIGQKYFNLVTQSLMNEAYSIIFNLVIPAWVLQIVQVLKLNEIKFCIIN